MHQVTLSDYYIGETEVTQALWQAVMGSNPSRFKGDNRPVENVSWNDCQDFIAALNRLTGKYFSLPTEAQWEFAARGGIKSKGYKYSGSNNIESVACYGENVGTTGGYETRAVATKQPNELGIYDMSGNVWEWCGDWYGEYVSNSVTDPQGPLSGFTRVCRGGSWDSLEFGCRCFGRASDSSEIADFGLGLRLVLCTEKQTIGIDLGLTSGTLWADRNIGADSPEEYGDYFAWGELEPKSEYKWETYQFWCDSNGNGEVDNTEFLTLGSDIRGTKYDAATSNWGDKWVMPTYDQFSELISECTWTWTTLDGVKGYEITGPNGNVIFLPAVGFRGLNGGLSNSGSGGGYWSSTLFGDIPSNAYCLGFSSSYENLYYRSGRCCGHAVRAVVR